MTATLTLTDRTKRTQMPGMRFARDFRSIVIPRLQNLAIAYGACIAAGVCDWADAHQSLWNYARRHGAAWLPDGVVDDLDDWLSATLLAAIDQAEAAQL